MARSYNKTIIVKNINVRPNFSIYSDIEIGDEYIIVSYDDFTNEIMNVGFTYCSFREIWKKHKSVIGRWKIK